MNRFIKVAMLLSIITVLLTAVSFKTAEAKITDVSVNLPHCQICLSHFFSRSGGASYKSLGAVTTVSASDVWAVGDVSGQAGTSRILMEHWDGIRWSVIKSPNPGVMVSALYTLAAVSANDIWGVGFYANSKSTSQTLIEHWDGSKWSVVKSPNPVGRPSNGLGGLSIISANDIWTVGNSSNSSGTSGQTLTEHWNGSKWSIVKSSNPGTGNAELSEVSAISSTNIWAVGTTYTSNFNSTLIEHWDGSTWSIVKSPNPGTYGSSLSGDVAISANNVWAVGLSFSSSSSPALIEHWDGSKWSVVKSPNPPGPPLSVLDTVVANSAHDIWTVGNAIEVPPNPGTGTLIEHWDGSKWSIVKSPNPGSMNNALTGIAIVSASDIWAVGGFSNNNKIQYTLIEHWNGSKWSVVKSPDITSNRAK